MSAFDDFINQFPVPPQEEQEYLEQTNDKVLTIMGMDKLMSFTKMTTLILLTGDKDAFSGMVLALISYGYTLKEDEDMSKPHKFSAQDFREDR